MPSLNKNHKTKQLKKAHKTQYSNVSTKIQLPKLFGSCLKYKSLQMETAYELPTIE